MYVDHEKVEVFQDAEFEARLTDAGKLALLAACARRQCFELGIGGHSGKHRFNDSSAKTRWQRIFFVFFCLARC